MSSDKLVDQLIVLLDKNFELSSATLPSKPDLNTIRQRLITVISWLLTHDLNRLLAIFYRIDLDEKKVNEILAFSESNQLAERLSDMVIERELQKAKTRINYRDHE